MRDFCVPDTRLHYDADACRNTRLNYVADKFRLSRDFSTHNLTLADPMITLEALSVESKPELYSVVVAQARALIEGEHDLIANLANLSSLLYHTLPDLNWAGFYLFKDGELVVGPFQGKPACVRIALGRGVCGKAAERRVPIIVSNVNEFDDHIACDSASNSEIVIPIIRKDVLFGVLDLDSPLLDRFDEIDRDGLTQIVEMLFQ